MSRKGSKPIPVDNIDEATKTWKLISIGCSLVACGFLAGIYIGNTNSTIEHQEKLNEYREQLIQDAYNHEKEIHELNLEISSLRDENNTLKHQLRLIKK